MPTDDTNDYFTLRIWMEDQQTSLSGHVSLEMHDGTYISVFRSEKGFHQCANHKSDMTRLGRDSDVTMKLLVSDHMRHPERIQNWLESYKTGEIIYDPSDTSCSVVYNLLVRSGCPSIDMQPFKLKVCDRKDYLYGILRYSKKHRMRPAQKT